MASSTIKQMTFVVKLLLSVQVWYRERKKKRYSDKILVFVKPLQKIVQ
jgi:hypothetical protein